MGSKHVDNSLLHPISDGTRDYLTGDCSYLLETSSPPHPIHPTIKCHTEKHKANYLICWIGAEYLDPVQPDPVHLCHVYRCWISRPSTTRPSTPMSCLQVLNIQIQYDYVMFTGAEYPDPVWLCHIYRCWISRSRSYNYVVFTGAEYLDPVQQQWVTHQSWRYEECLKIPSFYMAF